jgi:hypothetical protein
MVRSKDSEMHRLVREPDGTMVPYLGAENWPFPVPLVWNDAEWHFDVDAKARESMFERIGEDEAAAMETCRAMAKSDQIASAQSAHGYRFRALRPSNGAFVLEYPSEYGSTGVMTVAVAPDGTVREKDLGPKTVPRAQAMRR